MNCLQFGGSDCLRVERHGESSVERLLQLEPICWAPTFTWASKMALNVGDGDSDNLDDVYHSLSALSRSFLSRFSTTVRCSYPRVSIYLNSFNMLIQTSLTTTPMGYPTALDSESPVSQDWDLNFEEIQCTGAYKISPRLRHSAFLDHADSPCIGVKQTSALASPTLPLFSAAANKDSFRTFSDSGKPMHLGHAHRTTDSMRVFGTFQARIWKSKSTWLVLYFSFNLLLTLSNKSVLTSFSFPYTLSALHALCSSLGGLILRWHGFYEPKRLSGYEEAALAAFSFLYSLNIAVSNVSLNMVTVPVRCSDHRSLWTTLTQVIVSSGCPCCYTNLHAVSICPATQYPIYKCQTGFLGTSHPRCHLCVGLQINSNTIS